MKKILFLLFYVFISQAAFAQDDALEYDIEPDGVGSKGMSFVKVSIYVKKPKQATTALLKKAAVHGIIFRGLSESGTTGYTKQRPLVNSPAAAQQYGDYFETFFQDGGKYLSYANMVGSITQVVKINKKYRVSATINVSTDEIRRALRDAGVIKGMTSGF